MSGQYGLKWKCFNFFFFARLKCCDFVTKISLIVTLILNIVLYLLFVANMAYFGNVKKISR